MWVERLQLGEFRRFEHAGIEPAPGLNLITGRNGAGKTSLLEALHVMAYGRSFRGRVRDGLIRDGKEAIEVFVQWRESRQSGSDARTGACGMDAGIPHKAGIRHTGQDWTGKLDGMPVSHLGELCAALAVVTFEPGSHALVNGGGEPRRRFLDWGLFHVEQDFLSLSRRYARALKQRNALLKSGAAPSLLDVWDRELAEAGEPLTRRRQAYVERIQARAVALAAMLAPSLGLRELGFTPGWRRHEMSLADALLLARDRDRQMGHTSVGPHRADWSVDFQTIPGRDALSRGQAKLTALACLMAQAEDYALQRGDWPVIALDDLASELDREHQQRVLDWLLAHPAQVFVTATELPQAMFEIERNRQLQVFHVEHGTVERR